MISQLFDFNRGPVSMQGDFVCTHFGWESDEASKGSTVSASIHCCLDAPTNSGGVDTVQSKARELHMEQPKASFRKGSTSTPWRYLNEVEIKSKCICELVLLYFLLCRCNPTRVMAFSFLRFLDHTHNYAPQSVGLLWTSDQFVAETSI
jgi:hypothetical protein